MSNVKRAKTSAVVGTVENAPNIDLDQVRAQAIARTDADMRRPDVPFERKPDGLDWARRIQAREAAGESLTPLAVELAAEALKPRRWR